MKFVRRLITATTALSFAAWVWLAPIALTEAPLLGAPPDPAPKAATLHRAFPRGARPTPRYKFARHFPFRVKAAAPLQVAYVPKQLSMWGNDTYGDCVSAEECFAKACYSPEIFVPDATVIAWAQANNYLNGANLTDVLNTMQTAGFPGAGQQLYNDGPYNSVDYSTESVLQSAIATGPVKLGIDANALPTTAGNQQGWSAFGGSPGQFSNEDHCVALCGYGPVPWLAQQLGVATPAGAPANGYLVFTWSTIGIVDHAWIMSTCGEAWLRDPTTVGVPPLTPPAPPVPPTPTPTPPTPPPSPTPGPTPIGSFDLLAPIAQGQIGIAVWQTQLPAPVGKYLIVPAPAGK